MICDSPFFYEDIHYCQGCFHKGHFDQWGSSEEVVPVSERRISMMTMLVISKRLHLMLRKVGSKNGWAPHTSKPRAWFLAKQWLGNSYLREPLLTYTSITRQHRNSLVGMQSRTFEAMGKLYWSTLQRFHMVSIINLSLFVLNIYVVSICFPYNLLETKSHLPIQKCSGMVPSPMSTGVDGRIYWDSGPRTFSPVVKFATPSNRGWEIKPSLWNQSSKSSRSTGHIYIHSIATVLLSGGFKLKVPNTTLKFF